METETKTENTNGNVNNVRILSREEDALYDGITIDSEDIDENKTYNKTYKTHILISSTTYENSKNFIEVNKISDVEIRGKAEKMDIYEVKEINL